MLCYEKVKHEHPIGKLSLGVTDAATVDDDSKEQAVCASVCVCVCVYVRGSLSYANIT